MQKIKRKKC